jgi:serine/threonine-protein kinase
LRHPNIVPLFDSGDADGVLYFVMPYEDGPSLRTRLETDGPVPIAEAVSVLRDVARALQYAHGQGVVHRDIKPDNVMLSGGAAVVADFGIAKAVSAAQAETSGGSITQTGAGIGTPAYMAPEQAIGDPSSDHRADLYSFGCVAYELLTGKPPFHDLSTHQIISAHMNTVPPLVNAVRADVPISVVQLIARCLAKEPGDRPQSAGELLAALDGAAITPSDVTQATSPRRGARALMVSGALVAVVALAAFLWRAAPPTMTVLPFGNIGNDSATSPLGKGLADEVFTALTRIPGLQMRSRNGARAYGGTLGVDEKAVGRALGVDYLLGADMREESGRWRITTRLTRTSDARELWNGDFVVDPQQQLGVAEQIANETASWLHTHVSDAIGPARALSANQRPRNAEAYRLYLLAQELLNRRGQSVRLSAERFRDAIARDSSYAPSYGGLSLALALYPYFEPVSAADVEQELTASAARALQLDSTLSWPHVALCLAAQHQWKWKLAEEEARIALRLAPTDVEAHVQYGRLLLRFGRNTEALQQFQRARALDIASPLVLSWLAKGFRYNGQMDSAAAVSAQAMQGPLQNYTAINARAQALLRAGRCDSARALAADMTPLRPNGAFVLGATGASELAWAKVRAINAIAPRSSTAHTLEANLLLGAGDTSRALTALEQATDAREMWPELTEPGDEIYASVSVSARFRVLAQRVGLPLSVAADTQQNQACR